MLFDRAVYKDYRGKMKLLAKEKDEYLPDVDVTINDIRERVVKERPLNKFDDSKEEFLHISDHFLQGSITSLRLVGNIRMQVFSR
jgi:hypothetical protein